jgi:DNA adenine methylase
MGYKTEPFLTWAGGKGQLLTILKEMLPENIGKFYEPFIGSGVLLLDLKPENAVINDNNKQLLNVYRQLKKDAESVIREVNLLDSVTCDEERYLEVRYDYNEMIRGSILDAECAAHMIWINKHCFSGLYRVNSEGLFNVTYNNKAIGSSINADNLRNIGMYLKSNDIDIRQGDFEDACHDAVSGDFIYFDSPYFPLNETANFTDYTKEGFSMKDHERLARLAKQLDSKGVKVMLSNHDVPLIYELYKGFNIETVDVQRLISRDTSKRLCKEVIITNYWKWG